MNDLPHTSTSVESWSVLLASDSTVPLADDLIRAGVRVSARWSLSDIADWHETPSFVDALIVDIRRAGEALSENVVACARAIADDRRAPVVAAVDAEQIDLAAAALLDRPHQILCDPSVAEILVALMNARTSPNTFGGVAGDESERLRQLNSEVARIAETLARLARSDPDAPRVAPITRERPLGFGMPPIEGSAPVDARDVRNLIRARRMRDNHFAAALFADPAWDMLLDLYAAELEHRRVSVSSLCIAAAVPGTTALRWIGTMVDVGLFERQADPFDRRRAYIVLTQRAREATAAYFDAVRKAGLFAG